MARDAVALVGKSVPPPASPVGVAAMHGAPQLHAAAQDKPLAAAQDKLHAAPQDKPATDAFSFLLQRQGACLEAAR